MRALRVTDAGTSLVEVPLPAADGEALVAVTLSGVCNTDLEIARGYAGFRGTLGHEFVGVVVDAGGGGLPIGTRVVGEISEVIGRDRAEHALQRAAAPGVLKVLLAR